ncbi:hypothetical protein, partial [Vibrio cholerae]|uniref:hypothetical protein n=1 Tax=Vibrio cholerae TaxID=666 RepID=UPI001C1187CF
MRNNKFKTLIVTMSTIQFQLQEAPRPKGKEAKSYYPVVAYGNKISGDQLCNTYHYAQHIALGQGT